MTPTAGHNTSVVIIGSGNVATHLARALADAGAHIRAVVSRAPRHAARLAQSLAPGIPALAIEDVPTDAEFYIIAVSDDAIASVAASLPPLKGIVAHTSGTAPISVLCGARCNGYGSFYPLQTFSRDRAVDTTAVPFFIEGDTPLTAQSLRSLARRISSTVIDADSHLRGQLHLAAVFASNFANVLWGVASDILAKENLRLDVLRPLLRETLEKAIDVGPDNAQTGPARRNDQKTISAHLAKISDPALKEIYSSLTNLIIDRQCQK